MGLQLNPGRTGDGGKNFEQRHGMPRNGLENIPVGYFVLNEGGKVEQVNDAGAALAGRRPEDLTGERFADLVAPMDTWRFLKHLREASLSTERQSCRLSLRRDGSDRLTHLFTKAERSDDGDLICYHTAVLTVAAELVEAKEEAERTSRLKTAFLANMSHEIRTPLTGIIGFATVLSKELPDEHREFAELIRGSGRRLLEMLNSVLDLAKLESNEISLQRIDVDLGEEVQKVVDLLQPLAQGKGLDLTCSVDEAVILWTDRAAINRVLHNLVGNAIKFTDRGRVSVRTFVDPEHAGFEVVDTGIGIDRRFLPELFEEFSQESSGMNRSHSGAGLGLAITHKLVDLMDGRIEVQTEKDVGSRFKIILPLTSAADPRSAVTATDQVSQETNVPSARSSPLRVLLVEDHSETQQLLVELLEEHYQVGVAGSAPDAFLLACQKQFDLVLMDIHLGDGPDGTDLLHQLRGLPEYESTPVVAVTAYAMPGDRERFLDLGFTEYVSKPFDVDDLIRLPSLLDSRGGES